MELGEAHAAAPAAAVVWHDLECGGYDADLPLWRELAGLPHLQGPILEVGAGSGRVCLELARMGHELTALEHDEQLLAALRERAGSLPLRTVHADARSFQLERRDFALCLVPMQTLQLFGGSQGRRAFMRCVRRHLRPGGLLACAVVTELEPFDSASESIRPSRELARVGDRLYCSEAVSVRLGRRAVRIERKRLVSSAAGADVRTPRRAERDVVRLDRVSASQLAREARRAGIEPAGVRTVPATGEYVASLVVMFAA